MRISRWDRTLPNAPVPKTAPPSTDSTSLALSGLPRPMPVGADAGERLRDEDHERVGDAAGSSVDRMAARPGVLAGSLVSSLTDDRGVPAPVDEHHQDDAAGERAEAAMPNGLSQDQLGVRWPAGRVAGADLDQRGDRQHQQHDDLDAEQGLLEVGRDLDAAVADVGHQDDPDDADQQHPAAGRVGADAVGVEQQEDVLPGDLGQAGHDQDVGGDDGPAAGPAGRRAERPGGPGERGAAVRVGLVQLAVADRGRAASARTPGRRLHGRLQADGHDDEAQRGREAVGRRDRRGRDHGAGDQPERTGFEALVRRLLQSACGCGAPWLAPPSPMPMRDRLALVRRTLDRVRGRDGSHTRVTVLALMPLEQRFQL